MAVRRGGLLVPAAVCLALALLLVAVLDSGMERGLLVLLDRHEPGELAPPVELLTTTMPPTTMRPTVRPSTRAKEGKRSKQEAKDAAAHTEPPKETKRPTIPWSEASSECATRAFEHESSRADVSDCSLPTWSAAPDRDEFTPRRVPKSAYPVKHYDAKTKQWVDGEQTELKSLVDVPTRVAHPWDLAWGQTCNRLHILSGILRYLRTEARRGLGLALGPNFSEPAWYLDLKRLSATVPVLYLDCMVCDKDAGAIKCRHRVIDGVVEDSSRTILKVDEFLDTGNLYWTHGPSRDGYMEEVANQILPDEAMRVAVEASVLAMTTKGAAADAESTWIAIHRRYMDNRCYEYIWHRNTELKCCQVSTDSNARFKALYKEYRDVWDSRPWVWSDLRNVSVQNGPFRVPLAIPCNYSLDEDQLAFLRRDWPGKFSRRSVSVFLADDAQAPAGRAALEANPLVSRVVTLQRDGINVTEPCFRGKVPEQRAIFAEAYAMSLFENHMGNPYSSCDQIVAIWRRALGRKRQSSYPTWCYEGFYGPAPA